MRSHKLTKQGFTIVELLIVIVVIAILAAIVIVAYNSMSRRAIDSAIQADLKQAVTKVELSKVEQQKYPAALGDIGVVDGDLTGEKVVYSYNSNAPDYTKYCISARSHGRTFYATEGKITPEPGYCDGVTGVPSDGTVAITRCDFTGITIADEANQVFSCPVPAGMDWLAISVISGSGGSGYGPNMYVKRGATPSSSSYDCRDGIATYVTLQCIFHAPQAGDYNVMINPTFGSGIVNATLEVIWGKYGPDTVPYTPPSVTVSGDHFSRVSHSYEVPAGVDYFVVSMLGNTSDTGMFGQSLALKYGSRPGLNSTDAAAGSACSSNTATYATDQCIVMNPTAGTWYIETYAYAGIGGSSSSGMGRNQSFTGAVFQAIHGSYNHTTQNYIGPVQVSGGAFARESYKITVPAGATSLTVTTAGGTYQNYGAALAVKYGSRPGNGSTNPGNTAECNKPNDSGNANTCTITSPVAGDYYIEVYSYYGAGGSSSIIQGRNQSFTNTTLTATIN